MLESRGLYRTDGKRPDGDTMIPWKMGKPPLWEMTAVDALAPSRLNQCSLCNPGTTATEADVRKKTEKYCEEKTMHTLFNWWPWKYRVVEFSSRASVKCSVVRTTTNELAAFLSNGFQWLFRSAMRPVFCKL